MKHHQHSSKPFAITLGAAVALGGAGSAQASLFQASELASGYQVAVAGDDKSAEQKCGEGACGGKAAAEKTAEEKKKAAEAHKADAAAKAGEAKCGEGKCGEGKCGEKPQKP